MDTTMEPQLSDTSEALLRWVAEDFRASHYFRDIADHPAMAPRVEADVIDHLAPIRARLAELEAAIDRGGSI